MRRDAIPIVSWQGLIFLGGFAAFVILIYTVLPILTRRRLLRWAESRGFRLVSFSTVPLYEGPRAWRRNIYQFDYRVVVETQSGVRREGWLLEEWPFLNLGHPTYEVQWDDVS
jgi:hypothetical protein